MISSHKISFKDKPSNFRFMKKILLFQHITLDGFVAGPNGEMDWIIVDDEIFDHVGTRVDKSDVAMYGRVTYEMMDNYWPTAAAQPNASKHDTEHGTWYNRVDKIVLSRSMKGVNKPLTTVISENLPAEIHKLKQHAKSDIIMFGSPTAAHALMAENLIDEYWLFINPILLGRGIPTFQGIKSRVALQLSDRKVFESGVLCTHYEKISS
jgi:dihydrofolate reductase